MPKFIDLFEQLLYERTDPKRKSPELILLEAIYAVANQGIEKEHQLICDPSEKIKYELQGDYLPLVDVDPQKPRNSFRTDTGDDYPIFDIDYGTYENWKASGATPQHRTVQKIADYFEIPVEMLKIGPIAYKVKFLINRNYTDLDYFCEKVGIEKEQLLESLKGKNDVLAQNLEKVAEYFQVPVDWLKSFDNPDGRGEAKKYFYTLNPNELETGSERKIADRVKMLLKKPFGIIGKCCPWALYLFGEESKVKLAFNVIGVFELEEKKVFDVSDADEIVKEYLANKSVIVFIENGKARFFSGDEGSMIYSCRILEQLELEEMKLPKPMIE